MTTETPDTWVILKLEPKDLSYPPLYYKLLVTYYGGYVGSDEWRVSSAIKTVEIDGDYYIITNESGSKYKCHKNNEGLSSLSSSTFERFKKELGDEISIIKIEEYLK